MRPPPTGSAVYGRSSSLPEQLGEFLAGGGVGFLQNVVHMGLHHLALAGAIAPDDVAESMRRLPATRSETPVGPANPFRVTNARLSVEEVARPPVFGNNEETRCAAASHGKGDDGLEGL